MLPCFARSLRSLPSASPTNEPAQNEEERAPRKTNVTPKTPGADPVRSGSITRTHLPGAAMRVCSCRQLRGTIAARKSLNGHFRPRRYYGRRFHEPALVPGRGRARLRQDDAWRCNMRWTARAAVSQCSTSRFRKRKRSSARAPNRTAGCWMASRFGNSPPGRRSLTSTSRTRCFTRRKSNWRRSPS